MIGKVYLVGAGPGDARLLTVRAAELISRARVLVLDALVSPEIAAMIPPDARVIDAGKRASAHTLTQDQTNSLLVREALAGNDVVRLKGGDPFVFGRGGEEAEELKRHGVPFEIVPGISAGIAAPAYAGIPVTHRAFATSVTLITGHESDESTGIKWDVLGKLDGTIVFYMGLGKLQTIADKLIAAGVPETRAVAVISRGTTPNQRSVTGTLKNISARVAEAGVVAPALIVVGQVVTLSETLGWFENRPLFGRRMLVTRARAQASDFASILEDAGATVVQFPMIRIDDPSSFDSLDSVVQNIGSYEWIVFTSTNGVEAFFRRLFHHGRDVRALARNRVAAVGQSTAMRLKELGIVADVVPEKFQSTELLPLLPGQLSGVRFAVIRAAEGRNELIAGLRDRGAVVDLAIAYETKGAEHLPAELRKELAEGKFDAVTFTSSSTVENLFRNLSDAEKRAVIASVTLASIGPVTSKTLQDFGANPTVEASEATVSSLARALIEHFAPATASP